MTITTTIHDNGVAEVVMDNPPVNALGYQGWYDVAEQVTAAGNNPDVRAVVLRAEGKGFNAGVDIKELQQADDATAIIGVNRGCYASFKAIYECPVPVISAVNDFCVGGGIGMVGNSDIIIASEGAVFGLPEVDRGALGAATHLSRMVPQHKMRAMFLLAENVTAEELHAYGSVYAVVPKDQLRDKALEIAGSLAKKNTHVIRAAKEALNGIDLWDVNRSYRFEQGFTFELNLSGVADEVREDFGR